MKPIVQPAVMALVGVLLASGTAHAQSAIAGVVKDASGAVIPGVTVEASSPALIQKVRTVVTDGSGQYKIVDLRPGIYTVTFTLVGFGTVKREGIELPGTFTATVNAEMKVGALEETVTVTGQSPGVDLQSSVAQSVMSRKVLDAIPSGRDVFAIGQLIPGVTTNTPDVGGSGGMQQPTLQVHGSNSRDMVYEQDGMSINSNWGNGNQTGFYYNDLSHEEISYQTSALPAEVGIGGVRISLIPKQGGNEFHGAVFASGANQSMQSDNLSQALIDRGLKAPNKLQHVYDVDLALGGPIKRDRLWFFGAFRRWGVNSFVANAFNPDGTQALDDNWLQEGTLRLTLSPNQNNKIAFGYNKNWKYRGHRRDNQPATFLIPEATMLQLLPNDYILQAKWTSTLSSNLLLEAGLSWHRVYSSFGYRPGTSRTAVTKYDFGRSLLYNAPIYDATWDSFPKAYMASLSYVTGQHNFKVGVQLRSGIEEDKYAKNGDIMLQFNNGVPDSVLLYNTPLTAVERMTDDGVFAQDSWTMKRLTVNAGVRFDYFNTWNPAQASLGGTWIVPQSYPEMPVATWKTVSPRLGIVYDLFGKGKTAIKASASEYVQGESVSLAQGVNPLFLTSQKCAWKDLNNDTEAQPNEITSCQGWGGGITTRVDPNLKRPRQWEYVGMLQQELMPRFTVSLAYYQRRISAQYGVRNLLVPPTGYSPVTITNPLDGSPLTVYNQDPATRGQQDLLLTGQDALWSKYQGFEVKVEKRFANGGMILGGFTAGRNRGNIRGSSTDLNNPNNLINAIGAVGYDATYQATMAGSWMLPFGIQWSGSLRTATGLPLTRTYTVTRSDVPNLTQVSMVVNWVATGAVRLQNNNLLDMRISKIFKVSGATLEALADIYNLLNSNATTGESQTVGPSLGKPSAILNPRLLRLGIQLRF